MTTRRTFFKQAGLFVAGCAMAVQLVRKPIVDFSGLSVSPAKAQFEELIQKILRPATMQIKEDFLRKKAQGFASGKPYMVPATDYSSYSGNQW